MAYVPGELIKEFIATIEPSKAVDAAFEAGIYDGDYVVVREPLPSWRAELKELRDAAFTKWPDRIVTFDDIAAWVENDAPDLLTGEKLLAASPPNPQKRAVHLINNGVFERHW